jgi:hypothetical protein
MKVTLTGARRFRDAIGRLALPKAEPLYRRALLRTAEQVQETTRREFLSGQLLHVITGELRGSIQVSSRGLPRYIEIGSGLEQAPPLHYGWPGKNIRPSPFLERAVGLSMPRFPEIWVREMEREVEKAR